MLLTKIILEKTKAQTKKIGKKIKYFKFSKNSFYKISNINIKYFYANELFPRTKESILH